ncbi:MAG: hypothetical protein U9O55_03850 [Patescibacteria group bacterium]|nr:hypothetical protein [Patescibacteria group bacterium]
MKKKEITLGKAIWKAILSFILVAIGFFLASKAEGGTYNGVDPQIFDKGTMVVYTTDAHRKIVSPDKSWTWYNSGHIVLRQPGVFGTARVNRGGYTLTNSFDSFAAEELTWAHYSFFLFKGNLPEEYDPVKPAEDRIWKELNQSARVIRIDKLAKNFYVVMYVRSDHKKFELEEVDGYPPFNLGDNIGITNNGILIDMKVKSLDPFSLKAIFTYQKMIIPVNNVVLLDPTFFQRPTELKTIFIHYDFFAKAFLYEHPEVAALYRQSGDPAVIRIMKEGIKLQFRKPVEYEVLE